MSEDGRKRPPSDANHPLPDKPGDKKALADFSDRLKKARKTEEPLTPQTNRGAALGTAIRLTTELVAAVVVGGVIGWFLDEWLGTAPFLLLIFFFLGVAAGILSVFRTAQELNAVNVPEQDDEEETGA